MKQNKKSRIFPEREIEQEVDDIYASQKKYQKTKKGKAALKRARTAYDERDPKRRRRQKREYMKRKRAEKKAALRQINY
tara:strand:+ start:1641 stop:1877 length:237 start_codon:yes stop_codon:yes gene_type:complete